MLVLFWLSRLPLQVLYLISEWVGWMLCKWVRYRSEVIAKNVAIAFPEYSQEEICRVERKFYKNLSHVSIEIFKTLTLSDAEMKRRVTVENISALDYFYKKRVPVVMLASHLCNWEWLVAMASLSYSGPIKLVVRRPSSSSLLTRCMDYIHTVRYGVETYEQHMSPFLLRSSRSRPCLYALSGDQCPHRHDAKHWASFFGKETAFFQGIERLPKLLQAPVLTALPTRCKRGYYKVSLTLLAEPPYSSYRKGQLEILPLYAKTLEQHIRTHPNDWLWWHKRWRYERHEVKE